MRTTMPHRRRGFTLVEITLVTGLTVFLAVLLSSVWSSINGFTTDAVGRGQLMQEMDMAAAALSRDLAGSLPIGASYEYASGSKQDEGRWVGWEHPNNNALRLCYDGGAYPDGMPDWSGATDMVIHYYLADDAENVTTKILVRENESTHKRFNVARNVNSMTVEESVENGAKFVKITLQFRYQQRSGATYFGPEYLRTFTLEARAPQ